jgi:6,7-dimethyl-8-ribityllumazine synthase
MSLQKIPHRSFENPRGRVAVIVADFHEEISAGLLSGVETIFENYEGVEWQVHHVPGSFELPLMAQKLARMVSVSEGVLPTSSDSSLKGGGPTFTPSEDEEHLFDVIVVLGCIVKGDTYHFEMVANECVRGCMQVMLQEDLPIVFEVLAPYTMEDGLKRSKGEYNHGILAAYAALDWLKKLND